MKKFFTALVILIPFNILKVFFLKLLGHCISYKSTIGLNLVWVNKISLDKSASISSFNFIKIDELKMDANACIKRLNYIKGPFQLILKTNAGISNQNRIRRAYHPITYGNSTLTIGENSIVVSNHFLDLTQSITIGDNSIIAGLNTYLWTHGYYHADVGVARIRIDGSINIGNNVYVGSSCIFNPGVTIGNAIHLGAGSVVSKDLSEPGMYVGQALRHIDNSLESIKQKLVKIDDNTLVEEVYTKK